MGITSPNGGSRQQEPRRAGRVIPFGKYLLLDRIAVGGMAEVYLAKSFGIEGFEKLLAIKRILPTMAEDDDFIEMFIDEAKIAGQLTHANIVPIFELGKIGESHYIAMEYVWGKDLLQIMNRFRRLRKRMPAAMVAWIATKMCESLDYAHNKRDRRGQPMNIIHRDVSPQNILVSYEGEVKIIDFGIAKAASRTTKTQAGVLKGKFGYMSPEQVRGLPIDLRSDIFAVGTCMYEALTSERLFLGESDFSTLEKVRNASVAPVMEVAEVPGELNEVVMRALKRDPGDRFQSAAELQEALQHYLAKQRPPFGTSKLASWLKTAFSAEMTREKAKLDSFANVGRPSVLAGPRRLPGAGAGTDDRPGVTRRPPPRPSGPGAPPPMPRPVGHSGTDELSANDLEPHEFDDLDGEATAISASPFEEAMGQGGGGEINEEPTQIFFSSDDLEELHPSEPPLGGVPAPHGTPSARPGVMQATFRPGAAQAVAARPSVPGAPAAMPPPARSLHNVARPPTGSQPLDPVAMIPGHAQSLPPERTPVVQGQRHLPTMEMGSVSRQQETGPGQRAPAARGSGRTITFALLGSAAMLALGIAGAVIVFGVDDVGTVEIRTTPSVGAAVIIDGAARGSAPLRIERIPSGERTIEIRAEGYETATRTVRVQEGAVAMLEIALAPVAASASPPQVARAETTETDQGAEEGGTEAPAAASAAEARREEAERRDEERAREREARREEAQRARAEERERIATRNESRPRERTQRATEPRQRATSGSGTLVINAIPWARVFVDGRDTGRNTPVPTMRVRSGTRTVGLRTADGQMHNFSVDVEPGATVRLMKRL